MNPFPFEQLSRDLMHALRLPRSQREFSELLGFDSNVAYTWESGRRFPETSVFLRAAELVQKDVRQRLAVFLHQPTGTVFERRASFTLVVRHMVEYLVGHGPRREMAERLAIDRTTLARWLKGTTEPRLPEFLRLIDTASQRLLGFVELFADPSALDSTHSAYADLLAQRRLAYELPWSHAVLRALELDDYRALPKHRKGFLARRIGISQTDEARYLTELEKAGQVRWDGRHWQVLRVLAVDTRQDPDKNRALKAHWADVGLSRLRAASTTPEALFSFNLFAIAEESFQKIRELHLDYYDRARAIIDESKQADRIVLMNLQLIPLDSDTGDRGE